MKIIIHLAAAAMLLAGCAKPAEKPPLANYETLSLNWFDNAAVVPHHCLLIITGTTTATNVEAIDVSTLEYTVTILGRYGWQFVSTETKGSSEIWHMQRQARNDGKIFALAGESAAEFNKSKP